MANEPDQNNEPEVLPAVLVPHSIEELQARTMESRANNDELYPSRLVVAGGESVVIYHLSLPQSVLIALLDASIGDGFIEIMAPVMSTQQPFGRAKHHFLHTSAIREVLFDKDLPADAFSAKGAQ